MHEHRRDRTPVATAVAAGLLGAAAAVMLLASTPAAAHGALVRSSPQDGSSVAREPAQVELTFDEDIDGSAYVVVTAPDGSRVGQGEPQVLGNTVTEPLDAVGLAGTYTLAYRVVSTDGHPVSGELTYTVTAGTPVEEADTVPAAATDHSSSFWNGHWPHMFIALGGALIAFMILPRWRRG